MTLWNIWYTVRTEILDTLSTSKLQFISEIFTIQPRRRHKIRQLQLQNKERRFAVSGFIGRPVTLFICLIHKQ